MCQLVVVLVHSLRCFEGVGKRKEKYPLNNMTMRYYTALIHIMNALAPSYSFNTSPPLCYVMLCYVVLCYVIILIQHLTSFMVCYVMSCYVMLCYVIILIQHLTTFVLCYGMLCYDMSCYVMLSYSFNTSPPSCYAMLCYDMLCYVMLYSENINDCEVTYTSRAAIDVNLLKRQHDTYIRTVLEQGEV